MSIVLMGSTSGSITLSEPAVAGSNTISLPAVTGTVVVAGQNSAITSGTAVNAATGSPTSIDFTGIPSWVKRITVMFNGVSMSGTSTRLVRLSTGSVFATSSYLGAFDIMTTGVGPMNFSSGFAWSDSTANASDVVHATYTFTLVGNNVWVGTIVGGASNATSLLCGGGSLSLGGTLDGVRITAANGTDTFDAGTINILYE